MSSIPCAEGWNCIVIAAWGEVLKTLLRGQGPGVRGSASPELLKDFFDSEGKFGVVIMFFLHGFLGLEPAEVALIGAAILLLWSREAPEMILEKIEWPALFFFGGLFSVVGALARR